MGRTALYRIPVAFRPRAEVHLEFDVVTLRMPDGRQQRCDLDGCTATTCDGYVVVETGIVGPRAANAERRFVRMLVLDGAAVRHVVITPPDEGAVAPEVVRLPEAPSDAVMVDPRAWEALADWVMGGGRFAACAIPELARLAAIAAPAFAVLIGELAAQRALEVLAIANGPLRGIGDLEAMLQPFVDLARLEPRVDEALVAALAHAAGTASRRR